MKAVLYAAIAASLATVSANVVSAGGLNEPQFNEGQVLQGSLPVPPTNGSLGASTAGIAAPLVGIALLVALGADDDDSGSGSGGGLMDVLTDDDDSF